MHRQLFKLIFLITVLFFTSLQANCEEIEVGASQTKEYIPLLKGKRVALLSNHTGMVGNEHTLDIMLKHGIKVTTIFSPEHGFRGNADAGEHVSSGVDSKTGIPIASLYDGKNRRPSEKVMGQFDILVVDIQDVGLRFYTYYVTMVDLINAANEYGKSVMVLDRPNPNGMYVDGPILDMKYKSGVGGLPIPVVHGLTMGEIATMANGEGWYKDGKNAELTVIKCKNYTHSMRYVLPVAPSPNLPNMHSIYLYPSTCYFEATPVSLGRGTDKPFQVYGHPNMIGYNYSFTPRSISGAKNPPQLDKTCYGVDLSNLSDDEIIAKGINLDYVIDAYRNLNLGDHFFRPFFELLIGNGSIRKMIKEGKSADEIKATWKSDVDKFIEHRRPYLLYAE
ncbi:MAG: DUF1343 domain-containing protein [Muribaculaceae bacterium]|nr:DUF1343 domain-containing protein [Muribaculaceae bacterium]